MRHARIGRREGDRPSQEGARTGVLPMGDLQARASAVTCVCLSCSQVEILGTDRGVHRCAAFILVVLRGLLKVVSLCDVLGLRRGARWVLSRSRRPSAKCGCEPPMSVRDGRQDAFPYLGGAGGSGVLVWGFCELATWFCTVNLPPVTHKGGVAGCWIHVRLTHLCCACGFRCVGDFCHYRIPGARP